MAYMVGTSPWREEPGSYLAHEAGYPSGCKLRLEAQEDHLKVISIVSVLESWRSWGPQMVVGATIETLTQQ